MRFGEAPKSEPAHLRAGKWGEALAASHLEAQGYRVIAARVKGRHRSEIDLIASKGETLIFVEVKTRSTERMGRPLAAIDQAKRDRIGRAALAYMRRLRAKPPYFRFDVVEVVGKEDDEADPMVRHIVNAFNLPRGYRVPW